METQLTCDIQTFHDSNCQHSPPSMSTSNPARRAYAEAEKRIHSGRELRLFRGSSALVELQQSLSRITQLVSGKCMPEGALSTDDLYSEDERDRYSHDLNTDIPVFPDSSTCLEEIAERPHVHAVLSLLSELSTLLKQVPPFPGPRRFGNMACREWHSQLESHIDEWMHQYIAPLYHGADAPGFLNEVQWYLVNAFGSKERLDYGTGHELNFLAFLTGLGLTDVLPSDTDGYDFLVVFASYYTLVRRLILAYSLEPAGSHGVWGLDDHFHIVYILGASQLLNAPQSSPSVSPKYANNRSIVFQYCTKNFYFNAVAFIYKVKKGAFFEHSPILYDISNVKTWEKILNGLLKMYQVEVFGKFPVVQHFYFGGALFPWTSAADGSPLPIALSEEDVSTSLKQTNEDWKQQVHHRQDLGTTAAPWKKQGSFQTDMIGRAPASPSQTRARQRSTRAPWTNEPSNSQPSTRAPWAKES